jgi:Uma2 family endonuclease
MISSVLEKEREADKNAAPPQRKAARPSYQRFIPTYTYRDYAAWPENFRAEIIDGNVNIMATPRTRHQIIIGHLFLKLNQLVQGTKAQLFFAPVCLRLFPRSDDKDTVVFEPDILIAADPAQVEDKYIKGAPALVVEVLSPSTAEYDKHVKLSNYQDAGVKEYWIVDPDANTVQVNVMQDTTKKYRAKTYGAEDTIELASLKGSLSLAGVFNG